MGATERAGRAADGEGRPAPGEGPPETGGERLAPGSEVTVRLVKHPREDVRYPAVVLRDDGTHAVARAPWAKAGPKDFGFVRFEPGDVFTEHYWRDRWFTVKEVRTGGGTLKGWYCDVTRPARVEHGEVVVEDLELDLWVSADRAQVFRLDEDEFLAAGLPERDPAAAGLARQALDDLELLARGEGFATLLG